MHKKYISHQLKKFTRAPQMEAKAVVKVFMGLIVLYFLGAFLFLGGIIYPAVSKKFVEQEALHLINQAMIYVFLTGLVFRYFFQQSPVTEVQKLLLLPIKKSKIVHSTLLRSLFSPYNTTPLLIYFPISLSMLKDDYLFVEVFAWWLSLTLLTFCLSLIVFVMNKNTKVFVVILVLFLVMVLGTYQDWFSLHIYSGKALDFSIDEPWSFSLYFLLFLGVYFIAYRFFRANVYLEGDVNKKVKAVESKVYERLNFMGSYAQFIKNDLKMIVRNVRPRQVTVMSFFFLFYGLFFFPQDIYSDNTFMKVFASLFITGGFIMTYGNYVPAWDSAYYKLLMSQNFPYRTYISAKWRMMFFSSMVLTLLSFPYLYFGWEIYFIILSAGVFNAGSGAWIALYGGLFNKSPMKLNVKAKAFENTQAFSLTQFLFTLPKLLLPILLYWVPATLWNPTAGSIGLAFGGLVGLLGQKYILNDLERRYKKEKYKMISSFET